MSDVASNALGRMADTNGRERVPTSIVAATVAGNALEFFDFGVYAFFTPFIAKAFFPTTDPVAGLLATLAVFGIGFLFRPLGGILFGWMADRHGRKPAMLLTIVLITFGTLALAITPTYASIGIAAPIIIVIARLIQGLALGGEVGPSTSFLIEIAPQNKRGIYSSWQLASQGLASMFAGGLGYIMASSLAPADLASWGWRVPFFAAVLLVPIALYLRSSMPETLEARPAGALSDVDTNISHHWGKVLASILVVLGGTVSTYIIIFLSTTYAMVSLKFPPAVAYQAAVVTGFVTFLSALLGGWLSDKFGRKSAMIVPRVLLLVGTYPAMAWFFNDPTPANLMLVCAAMAALVGISGAASFAAIPEIFPSHVRALGLSIAYAVGVAIFGGSTQLVAQWMITATGNPLSLAWYAVAASVLCLIGMFLLPETKNVKVTG